MKKGMTLVEIIVSLAIFTIVLTSISTIFTSTLININDNGDSINNTNEAMAELNIALTTPTYTGENNTVSQNIETIDVNGTDVPIRHIVSNIVDPSGKDTANILPIEAFVMPQLTSSNPTGVFVDFDGNETFDTTDRAVSQEELNRGFSYLGSGNLIISANSAVNVSGDFNVKVKDDVIIKRGASITSGGEISIECDEFLPSTNVSIIANNDVYFDTNVLRLINSIYVKSITGSVTLGSDEVYVEGIKSDGSSTIISAKTEVIFDISSDGLICLGTKGNREPVKSLYFFEIDGQEGYALNKNMTPFSDQYEYPHYKDEATKDYFKQYK